MSNFQQFDASLLLSDVFDDACSSAASRYLILKGDTVRVTAARTISSSTATGYPGEICWDASYLYICTAVDTWSRVALAW